jgi:hypothetical protein
VIAVLDHHLTARTFYQMFGMPPSLLMRGAFTEIPSPFGGCAAVTRAARGKE